MTYDLPTDQAQFRDAIQAYLGRTYSHETRREIIASEPGWSADVWRGLAIDLGVFGLGFDESLGGLGGNAIDQIPVMESFGQALLVEPYLETVVQAGGILRRSTQPIAKSLITHIIGGDVRLAVARTEPEATFAPDRIKTVAEPIDGSSYRLTGRKAVVVGGPWADQFLVVARKSDHDGELSVFAVPADAPGLSSVDYRTVDGRRASDIELSGVVISSDACLLEGPEAADAIIATEDAATAAICAEAVGVMRRLLGETHAYLNERRQFGVTLASFQALQHRMADMLMALELSSAHAYRAASALGQDAKTRQMAVSAAKAFIGRAAHRMGQEAVQMHGGMGMTDELIIGHLFKRAVAIEAQFGSTEHHVRRFQALRGQPTTAASIQ